MPSTNSGKRQKRGPQELQQGEQVKLVTDGCLNGSGRARWRMGQWTLTDRRMIFCQSDCVILQVPFERIVLLREEDRPFAFGTRRALTVVFKDDSEKDCVVSALGVGLSECVTSIRATTLQPVDEVDVMRVVEKLKPPAEQIVWHLWERIHANIHELASVVGNCGHMQILKLIREEINAIAKDVLGHPLLVFEHRRNDPLSGKEILFSWWLAGSHYRDVIVDDYCEVFDEGDFCRVVAEPRGISVENIEVLVEDGAMVFRKRNDLRIIHEIELPSGCGPSFEIKGVRNGMMEIVVPKHIGG